MKNTQQEKGEKQSPKRWSKSNFNLIQLIYAKKLGKKVEVVTPNISV